MLHKEPHIISAETFLLIQQLQALPDLHGFHLVGGTALALQLGHRNSIDIDLFTQNDFNSQSLGTFLKTKFLVRVDYAGSNTLLSNINTIKADFIKHPYAYVKPPITEEGITYLSKEDIAAMKLNAIVNSGQRLKDFIDIYFLLEYFSVTGMLSFFEIKYPGTNPLIALKAVSYFEDIDETADPPKLVKPLTVKKIKQRISNAVTHTSKVFVKEIE
ncbi:MAG: nucleotidyl transferase AbiEii/AbiGii toxin family protein [Ginsengibacter sp.]